MASSEKQSLKFKISVSSGSVQSLQELSTEAKQEHGTRTKARKKAKNRKDSINPGWRPDDDYLLINSVMQLNNLYEVCTKVKFINKFTLSEIERRWKELLYNHTKCSVAMEAIGNLPLVVKAQLDRLVPFSAKEENELQAVKFTDVFPRTETGVIPSKASEDPFRNLLLEKPGVFYSGRTAKALYNHWNLLRKHGLLQDDPTSNSQRLRVGGDPTNFDDSEHLITRFTCEPHLMTSASSHYQDLTAFLQQGVAMSTTTATAGDAGGHQQGRYQPRSGGALSVSPGRIGISGERAGLPAVGAALGAMGFSDEIVQEMTRERHNERRRLLRRLRTVAEEAQRWSVLVEHLTGTAVLTNCLPRHVLATLTGSASRYLIKSREATFGRRCAIANPDIDLSCEGHATRVSRLQGRIRIEPAGTGGGGQELGPGQAFIANFGRRPVFVDGIPVLNGEEVELRNEAIIAIDHMTFRFDLNADYCEENEDVEMKEARLPAVKEEDAPEHEERDEDEREEDPDQMLTMSISSLDHRGDMSPPILPSSSKLGAAPSHWVGSSSDASRRKQKL